MGFSLSAFSAKVGVETTSSAHISATTAQSLGLFGPAMQIVGT
jgi:hypothetical protein